MHEKNVKKKKKPREQQQKQSKIEAMQNREEPIYGKAMYKQWTNINSTIF